MKSDPAFSTARAIPRDEFCGILEQTAYFTQFIVSPFGLPFGTDVFSGASDEFTNIYHQWEETCSRILYSSRGITDSSIAASMHEYVDKNQDPGIVRTMRKAADGINVLLQGSAVVELPDGLTAANVADMLIRVATLYRAAFSTNTANNYDVGLANEEVLSVQHERTGEMVVLSLPVRQFNAHDILASSKAASGSSCADADADDIGNAISIQFLRRLLKALKLPSSPGTSTSVASVSGSSGRIEDDLEASLSSPQFAAILDVFCESTEVNEALLGPLGLPVGGRLGLLCLRCGVGGWFPLAHPSVSFVALADALVGERYRAARKAMKLEQENVVSTNESADNSSAQWIRASGKPVVPVSQRKAAIDGIDGDNSSEVEEDSDWEDCDSDSDSDSTGNISEAEDPHKPRDRRNVGVTPTRSSSTLKVRGEEQMQEAFEALCQTLSDNTNTGLGMSTGAKTVPPAAPMQASAVEKSSKDGTTDMNIDEADLDFDDCDETDEAFYDNYYQANGGYDDDGSDRDEEESEEEYDYGKDEEEDEAWVPPEETISKPAKPWVEVPVDSCTNALFDASCSTSRAMALLSQASETIKAETERQIKSPVRSPWACEDDDTEDEEGDHDDDDDDDDDDEVERKANRQSVQRLRMALKNLNAAFVDDAHLPVSVRVGILVGRASCKLQLGQLDGALFDCEAAVTLDPKCAQAYSVRADIKMAMFDGELGEEEECNGDSDSDGTCGEYLYDTARDALRAFLLGGSVDLELAAKAEDISREACRVESKRLYNARVARRQRAASLCESEGSESTVSAEGNLNTNYLPKTWLVISYLQGYEPLERGLEIDSERAEKAYARSKRREEAERVADEAIGEDVAEAEAEAEAIGENFAEAEAEAEAEAVVLKDAGDETENDNKSDSESQTRFITPPQHLLDLNALEVFREYDHFCYHLLREAAAALESDYDLEPKVVKSYVSGSATEPASVMSVSEAISADNAVACKVVDTWTELGGKGLLDDEYLVTVTEETPLQPLLVVLKLNTTVAAAATEAESVTTSVAPSHISESVSDVISSLQQYMSSESISNVATASSAETSDKAAQVCSQAFMRTYRLFLDAKVPGSDVNVLEDLLRVKFSVNDHGSIIVTVFPSQYIETPLVASPLRARLLNIVSSLAFLAGDSIGAAACLRESYAEDPRLLDTHIKLGCLLIDMDELEEASDYLHKAIDLDPQNPIVNLHMAELHIHKLNYAEAVGLLRSALNLLESGEGESVSRGLYESPLRDAHCKSLLAANIYSLLGVAQFRANPTTPDVALRVLEKGAARHPQSVYILLCQGEILSQVGEVVKAIKCFESAAAIEENSAGCNPLPFINAARTYQQLSQPLVALKHIALALKHDSFLPMTFVDLAQILIHLGLTKEAMRSLDHALVITRHCSEIRDVLTARTIAQIQLELETKEHICRPKCNSAI